MNATGHRYGTATITTPSDLEIVITRRFDAPASLVFTAWTTPEYVRNWWGYATSPLIVCDIDLRVGGAWRYVTRDADGVELGWHGEYLEIVAGQRVVSTEVFEGFPEAATVNTLVLTEDEGVTTLVVTVLHTSTEHRDGHLASGMAGGLQHGLDRFEDLVTGGQHE